MGTDGKSGHPEGSTNFPLRDGVCGFFTACRQGVCEACNVACNAACSETCSEACGSGEIGEGWHWIHAFVALIALILHLHTSRDDAHGVVSVFSLYPGPAVHVFFEDTQTHSLKDDAPGVVSISPLHLLFPLHVHFFVSGLCFRKHYFQFILC